MVQFWIYFPEKILKKRGESEEGGEHGEHHRPYEYRPYPNHTPYGYYPSE